MADLDHFKRVNDSFGHPVGDQVLAHFAHLLKSTTRPTDVVARFGGEEFLVLMPHTTRVQAAEIAKRIRNTCSRETVPPLLDPVTASFEISANMRTPRHQKPFCSGSTRLCTKRRIPAGIGSFPDNFE